MPLKSLAVEKHENILFRHVHPFDAQALYDAVRKNRENLLKFSWAKEMHTPSDFSGFLKWADPQLTPWGTNILLATLEDATVIGSISVYSASQNVLPFIPRDSDEDLALTLFILDPTRPLDKQSITPAHQRCQHLQLGFWLDRDYQGQGITKKGLIALIGKLPFEVAPRSYITIRTRSKNTPSGKIAAFLGMRPLGSSPSIFENGQTDTIYGAPLETIYSQIIGAPYPTASSQDPAHTYNYFNTQGGVHHYNLQQIQAREGQLYDSFSAVKHLIDTKSSPSSYIALRHKLKENLEHCITHSGIGHVNVAYWQQMAWPFNLGESGQADNTHAKPNEFTHPMILAYRANNKEAMQALIELGGPVDYIRNRSTSPISLSYYLGVRGWGDIMKLIEPQIAALPLEEHMFHVCQYFEGLVGTGRIDAILDGKDIFDRLTQRMPKTGKLSQINMFEDGFNHPLGSMLYNAKDLPTEQVIATYKAFLHVCSPEFLGIEAPLINGDYAWSPEYGQHPEVPPHLLAIAIEGDAKEVVRDLIETLSSTELKALKLHFERKVRQNETSNYLISMAEAVEIKEVVLNNTYSIMGRKNKHTI